MKERKKCVDSSVKLDELVVGVVVKGIVAGAVAMGLAYVLDEVVLELGSTGAMVAPETRLLSTLVSLVPAQVLGPHVQLATSLAFVLGLPAQRAPLLMMAMVVLLLLQVHQAVLQEFCKEANNEQIILTG